MSFQKGFEKVAGIAQMYSKAVAHPMTRKVVGAANRAFTGQNAVHNSAMAAGAAGMATGGMTGGLLFGKKKNA